MHVLSWPKMLSAIGTCVIHLHLDATRLPAIYAHSSDFWRTCWTGLCLLRDLELVHAPIEAVAGLSTAMPRLERVRIAEPQFAHADRNRLVGFELGQLGSLTRLRTLAFTSSVPFMIPGLSLIHSIGRLADLRQLESLVRAYSRCAPRHGASCGARAVY